MAGIGALPPPAASLKTFLEGPVFGIKRQLPHTLSKALIFESELGCVLFLSCAQSRLGNAA
jgi:hypothetical protein